MRAWCVALLAFLMGCAQVPAQSPASSWLADAQGQLAEREYRATGTASTTSAARPN